MRAYAIEKGLFDGKKTVHHDATVYGEEFDRQVDFGMREAFRTKSHRVYDAWLSGFMAQGIEGVLKVLVNCGDDGVRVDRIVNRDVISVEEAKEHIFERENKNKDKWRKVYAKEWQEWVGKEPIDFWDAKLYDLVIDTYSHSREETLQLTLDKLGYVATH